MFLHSYSSSFFSYTVIPCFSYSFTVMMCGIFILRWRARQNACFKEMAAKMSSYTYLQIIFKVDNNCFFTQSRSALQLAHTELFRAQIEYSVGDMDTMMALSFWTNVSGHVQDHMGNLSLHL